jgi:hypothetical protein
MPCMKMTGIPSGAPKVSTANSRPPPTRHIRYGGSQYEDTVWQLARRIADLYYTIEVPHGELVTDDELRNVFKEVG